MVLNVPFAISSIAFVMDWKEESLIEKEECKNGKNLLLYSYKWNVQRPYEYSKEGVG